MGVEMARGQSPIEPAKTVVGVVLALVGVGVLLTATGVLLGSGSIFGIGRNEVCVDARNGVVGVSAASNVPVADVVDGVRATLSTVTLCDGQPTLVQRVLRVLNELPSILVFVGSLMLAISVFRAADSAGIFTDRLARRMRLLGWFILLGELVATLTEALSRIWLTQTMVTTSIEANAWLSDWNIPLLGVFIGAVLLSFSRVIRISARMRVDLEGTV
ncbi:hypothetical protein [Actinophytocola glycyrrhizae]|uniref:DUF2975 domain-containing protein n=1 Tax=Actinophytocola glycyrrhizae TaxID=2044873 RepID=A0ABV9RXW0_9PSEU